MKKILTTRAVVVSNTSLNSCYYIITVALPKDVASSWHPLPGSFVQIAANAPDVFLRRPISIASFNATRGELSFLIQQVGKATTWWRSLTVGSLLDIIGPLGNGFTTNKQFVGSKPLLVAGGVGIAPIRMLAEALQNEGITPTVLYGARSKELFVFREELHAICSLQVSTEDGSLGKKGFVTELPAWVEDYTSVFTCGPRAMMNAVARMAKAKGIPCELSLENRMACGIGACLCCVEKTTQGNVCVCSEGPVFRADKLVNI